MLVRVNVIGKTADNLIDQNMNFDNQPFASGAECNLYMDQHKDECLLGTRTGLLPQIREWTSSLNGKCLFRLNGMAGTGKPTISQTVAKSLKETKYLQVGVSFSSKEAKGIEMML